MDLVLKGQKPVRRRIVRRCRTWLWQKWRVTAGGQSQSAQADFGKQQQTGRVEIDGGRFRAPTSDINQQCKLHHPLELIHSEKQSWEVNCSAGNARSSLDRTLSSETYGAIADTIAFQKMNFSVMLYIVTCPVYDTAWGVKEPRWLGTNILPSLFQSRCNSHWLAPCISCSCIWSSCRCF